MSGRKWAYLGVILGFTASITANIASTVLKDTDVSLWLRIPMAALWPLFTYVAIEVLVRTNWSDGWSHRGVRLVLAGPVGLVAAFVSYLHQHHLMVLAGEPGLAQGFGPLAVDGMLFGMTATLIITRVKALREDDFSVEEMMEKWSIQEEAPISPAPMSTEMERTHPLEEVAPISAPPARRSSWDARKVAEMILAGEKTENISSATGAGAASIGRFRKVIRMIREDNRTVIDPAREKVTSDNVRMIRELVTSR